MAPTRRPPPTYHVVPRLDIAARGGVLELGTVLDDLLMLRPLNRGDIVPIPSKLLYPPVTHSGFTDTRSRLREGHGSIWAKALVFQGVGTSATASASAQNEAQRTVACESVVTSYFDPDMAYVAQSLAARGVDDHFVGSGYEDDVYLVTGLKVAKKLRFGSTTSAQRAASAEVGAQEPAAGTQVGATAGGTANDGHEVEFEADDIVVGFRVRRYAYVPASRNPFSKKKKLSGEDYLENAEMHEAGSKEVKGREATYDEVPIEEELAARKEAEASGEVDECWVNPFK